MDALVAEAIAEGETIEAVEDAIPVIGFFFSALWSIGLVASITETSAQIGSSPRTYIDEIAFTHDIDVTIKKDPKHPAGFPSTASGASRHRKVKTTPGPTFTCGSDGGVAFICTSRSATHCCTKPPRPGKSLAIGMARRKQSSKKVCSSISPQPKLVRSGLAAVMMMRLSA